MEEGRREKGEKAGRGKNEVRGEEGGGNKDEKEKEQREKIEEGKGRQERGVKGESQGWREEWVVKPLNCKLLYEYCIDNFIHCVYHC